MAQYIDKSALVAEINRVLNSYDPNEITSGRYALVSLRNFIDTLEVKEVDLEKEIFIQKELGYIKGYREKAIKRLEELEQEPVSEDIQKVGSLKSFEYYPEKKTTNTTGKGVFDANMPRRKAYLRGFKDGAHAHKELIANKTVSEDLENEIDYLSKRYPEVSFSKLSRIAVHVANWQKQQMTKDAVETIVDTDANGIACVNVEGVKPGDKVKVLIIKED